MKAKSDAGAKATANQGCTDRCSRTGSSVHCNLTGPGRCYPQEQDVSLIASKHQADNLVVCAEAETVEISLEIGPSRQEREEKCS